MPDDALHLNMTLRHLLRRTLPEMDRSPAPDTAPKPCEAEHPRTWLVSGGGRRMGSSLHPQLPTLQTPVYNQACRINSEHPLHRCCLTCAPSLRTITHCTMSASLSAPTELPPRAGVHPRSMVSCYQRVHNLGASRCTADGWASPPSPVQSAWCSWTAGAHLLLVLTSLSWADRSCSLAASAWLNWATVSTVRVPPAGSCSRPVSWAASRINWSRSTSWRLWASASACRVPWRGISCNSRAGLDQCLLVYLSEQQQLQVQRTVACCRSRTV